MYNDFFAHVFARFNRIIIRDFGDRIPSSIRGKRRLTFCAIKSSIVSCLKKGGELVDIFDTTNPLSILLWFLLWPILLIVQLAGGDLNDLFNFDK